MTTRSQNAFRTTNSFKEFTKEYVEPTAVKHYKPTETFRKLSIDDNNMKTKMFKYVPNCTTVGNTWDAKHLDLFLTTSPWGQSSGTLKTQTLLENYAASLPQSRTSLPKAYSTLKSSYYFRNSDRFGPEQNAIHNFTHKVCENNVNQLVTNLPVQEDSLKNHYNKMLTRSQPPMETKALEFSIKPDESTLPHARRSQVEEMKKSQQEFKKWKEANQLVTKRNRVYKAGFKSGILSLDNPLYDSTLIYKEEHDQMKARYEEKRKIEAKHREEVAYLSRTNPQVEFMNKEAKLIDDVPEHKKYYLEKPITAHNGKVRVNMPHTKLLQDSQDRLFGAETHKYSLRRAEYLRSQELRGKNYDILSNVVNDVQLKEDRNQQSAFVHPLGKSILVKE